MTVRIGVIGTGNMGADHIRNLQRFVAGAEVTVVADYNRATAEAVAAESGARVADDGDALIADAEVDAVIIASHDSTHYAYALAAVAAGKPTLCEKPLAPTLAECEEIVAAEAAAGGNLLSLGFMRRFDPAHTELKAAIDAGVIGPVLRITGASRNVVSYPGTTSESIITNSVIHELDSIPWLLGSPVVSVAWLAGRATSKVPEGVADPSLTLLRTADGVLTSVDMYVNAEYGYDLRTEVLGEKGALSLTDPALAGGRSGPEPVHRLPAGLAAPVRRRVPAGAGSLGRVGGRRSAQPAGQCGRRAGGEPGRRRRDHLDARGRSLGRGRSMSPAVGAARGPHARTRRTAPSLRWGVIGTGWIADRFVAVPAAALQPAGRCGRLADAVLGPVLRRPALDRGGVRLVRGAGGRRGRGRGLRRHPAQRPPAGRAAVAGRRQAHRGGEAVGRDGRRGPADRGSGRGGRGVLHGGDVDRLPAEVRRAPAAAGLRCPGRTTQRRGRLR